MPIPATLDKPRRHGADMPRDKPQVDRTEHANLERPGAQAHPRAQARAAGWAGCGPHPWRLH